MSENDKAIITIIAAVAESLHRAICATEADNAERDINVKVNIKRVGGGCIDLSCSIDARTCQEPAAAGVGGRLQ
jgi:hypothetical protein